MLTHKGIHLFSDSRYGGQMVQLIKNIRSLLNKILIFHLFLLTVWKDDGWLESVIRFFRDCYYTPFTHFINYSSMMVLGNSVCIENTGRQCHFWACAVDPSVLQWIELAAQPEVCWVLQNGWGEKSDLNREECSVVCSPSPNIQHGQKWLLLTHCLGEGVYTSWAI